MRLTTFRRQKEAPGTKREVWGIQVGTALCALAGARPDPGTPPFPATLLAFLQEGDAAWERAQCAADEIAKGRSASFPREGQVRFLPPVPRPPSFLDFYAFEEHVRNARARRGLEVPPEWYRYPAYYNSNPHTLLGDDETVSFPAGETKMDFELELGVILRRGGRDLTEQEAAQCIAGYTIVNDWSARALQREVMAIGLGPSPAKDFATSVGPILLTPDEIPADRWSAPGHPALTMVARVNGEEWSRGSSGDARFTFPQMIAFASRFRTLYPGDLIGSGTVGTGCGLEQGRFLSIGDRVELEVEFIGALRNVVRRWGE
jgi:fumarylacetoacetate (FAA) hydrolase